MYEPFIAAAARKHGVDPRVLWTIAYLETRFRPELVSPARARGLMQFMPGTARRFNLTNPHDGPAAIDAAARYVKEMVGEFGGANKSVNVLGLPNGLGESGGFGKELREMNSAAYAILNCIFAAIGAFVFGFIGLEYLGFHQEMTGRLLYGFGFFLTVLFIELYFFVKYISKD